MRTRESRWLLSICLGLSVLATARPAAAEIEAGFFLGAHFFNEQMGLGRRDYFGPETAYKHGPMLGLRLGYLPIPRVGIEGELGIIPTSTTDDRAAMTAIAWRAHVILNILTGRFRPFVLAGGGGMTSTTSNPAVVFYENDPMFHAGVGMSVDIGKCWGLRVDGRMLFPPATGTTLFTYDGEVLLAGFGRFGGKCAKADEPPPPPPAPVEPPKPAVVDADGDGVNDPDDKCPADSGPVENGGCPDKDGDGDAIVDRLDKCPGESGPKENFGCPDKDGDGDTVVDRLDQCADKAGPASNNGCPEPDGDGDGIVDKDDKCADKPETKNGYQDADGCPDEIPKTLAKFTGSIQGIVFQPASAVIVATSLPVLDKAAAVLKEFADVRLEIAGHTDTSGDAAKNTTLSQSRAEAVKAYLVKKGIDATRLDAKGYGPTKPVADNATAAGRSKNRRVEFTLLSGSPAK